MNSLKVQFGGRVLWLLVSMLISALSYAVAPEQGARVDAESLLQTLKKDTPTLADYQTYFGYNDHYEMAFAWKACEDKGQSPPLQAHDCHQDIVTSWSKKTTAPSLFMAWLKTQLPANSKVTIKAIDHVGQDKGGLAGERIQAQFDAKTSVVFWRATTEADRLTYGRLAIKEINGVPIDVLVQRAGSAPVLGAMGLTALVRPLTADEQQAMQAKSQAQCAANPDCAKHLAAQEKELTEHKQEEAIREKMGKSYETWCKANTTACDQQKQERQKLLEARTGLATQCEQDYQKCLPEVARWVKAQQAQVNLFCVDNAKECAEMDTLRRKHELESQAWCDANPKECAKNMKRLDKAIAEVRAKL